MPRSPVFSSSSIRLSRPPLDLWARRSSHPPMCFWPIKICTCTFPRQRSRTRREKFAKSSVRTWGTVTLDLPSFSARAFWMIWPSVPILSSSKTCLR